MSSLRPLVVAVLFLFLSPLAFAQLPQAGDTTSPPTAGAGHDYISAPQETVNPANGSVSIRIPLRIPSGRELTLPLYIAYDSNGSFYYGQPSSGSPIPHLVTTPNVPFSQGGWSYTFPLLSHNTQSWTHSGTKPYPCTEAINFVFQDPTGNRHNLGLLATPPGPGGQQCGSSILSGQEGPIVAGTETSYQYTSVTDGNGTSYSFNNLVSYLPTSIFDRNGNTISISSTSNSASVTDTAGRTAVSIASFGANPDSINVKGLSSPYHVYWTTASANYTIHVDNSGPGACSTALSASASAISQVVLPNGQSYSFTYDPTYGTVSKITYPSGGYVRYVWGLNSLAESGFWPYQQTNRQWECSYDFPAITDRYVSFDGSTEVLHQHFAYTTSWSGLSWTTKTTTVTTYDLIRNTNYKTVFSYVPFNSPLVPNVLVTVQDAQQMPYEQAIQYYDTNGSLLKTVAKGWYENAYPPTLDSLQTNGEQQPIVSCCVLLQQQRRND